MTTIGDKKVSLALQDGSSINLNKPKVLPANITSFTQITEPGFYRGGLIYTGGSNGAEGDGEEAQALANSDEGIAAQAQHPDLYVNTNIPDFDDSEINFVITDGPDCNSKFGQTVPDDATNKYVFDLLVVPNKNYLDSPTYISKYKRDVMSYTFILFVAGYIYTSQLNKYTYYTTDENADVIVDKKPFETHNDEIPDGAVTKSNGNVITASNWIEAGESTISIINDLTSTDNKSALSAAQGKVLKDLIDSNSLPKELEDSQDILKIANCGWYRGKPKIFTANVTDQTVAMDQSYINAPILDATVNSDGYVYTPNDGPDVYVDLFVLGTDYIMYIPSMRCEKFAYDGDAVYYGTKSSDTINWSTSGVNKKADKTDLDTKMNAPIYSSTDLTPGTSELADGQIYIVYYN